MTREQYESLQIGDTVYSGKWPACVISKDEDGITTGPWPTNVRNAAMITDALISKKAFVRLTERETLLRLEKVPKVVLDEDNRQKQLNHFRTSGTCSTCIYSRPVVGSPMEEWCKHFNCCVDFNNVCDLYE